jgi:hypothetical protein
MARLAIGTFALSIGDLYVAPANTVVRIEVVRVAVGLAGNLTLRLEDQGGVSHNLINAAPILANTSLEMRDLILEPGWRLRGLYSAAGADYLVFGTPVSPPPTNPRLRVLAKTTLNGNTPVVIYTVPPSTRTKIKHIVAANGGTTEQLTIQYETAGGTIRNYRNQEVFEIRQVKEDFDIDLNDAGDRILAAGRGDITILGLEIDDV